MHFSRGFTEATRPLIITSESQTRLNQALGPDPTPRSKVNAAHIYIFVYDGREESMIIEIIHCLVTLNFISGPDFKFNRSPIHDPSSVSTQP